MKILCSGRNTEMIEFVHQHGNLEASYHHNCLLYYVVSTGFTWDGPDIELAGNPAW